MADGPRHQGLVAWLMESPKPFPTILTRLLAGLAVAAAVAGVLVAAFELMVGGAAIAAWWPFSGNRPDPYFRFISDRASVQWVYTFTTGASLAALGVLGYHAIDRDEKKARTRDPSRTIRRAAAMCVVMATCLLIAAAFPSYVATPGQRMEFTDPQFPTSQSGAFNTTYRVSAPIHMEQGRFLEGAFFLRWSVWPNYTQRATTLVIALDRNGSPVVPADFLYAFQVPATGDYLIIVEVPSCESMYDMSICPEPLPPAQVSGHLTIIDPSVFPPLQLGLETLGLVTLALSIGLARLGRRPRLTPTDEITVD